MEAIEAIQRGAQGYLSKGHIMRELVPQALHNIIRRKVVEEALYLEKTRAEITLNSISDAVISTDLEGNVDYMNNAAENITGWPSALAVGRQISEVFQLISDVTREPAENPVDQALKLDCPMELNADMVLVRRDGQEVAIEDSIAPIHDAHGKIAGAVVVFHDVTVAQALSRRMAHLAHHDFLTNLPNRVLLNDRIAQGIAASRRNDEPLALLFLDLDNFKHINDSLGHEIGDRLLQSVTQRLLGAVRGSDTVSRLGGDEFVILLNHDQSDNHVATAAEKICRALAIPHAIDQHELYATSSIGISLFPADGDDAATLIKNADTAMYHAKEHGRNNFQFFSAYMNSRAVERQRLEANLRHALTHHEFEVHYQPKVDLTTGKITGAEALLRWPRGTGVGAQRMVAIAEDCGIIVALGHWVLSEACTQAKRWSDAGHGPLSVAVNISALEFRRANFLASVCTILDKTGLEPGRLQLEITESVLMRDRDFSTDVLNKLKGIGVQLAMDDFGTGYSSLSYLQKFPIDVLKIDQSFIRDIRGDNGDAIIVSAVIAMGNSLSKLVIAEGIESRTQLAFLKEHRCREGQGYYFSHPLGAEQFSALLASRPGGFDTSSLS
jgi:diguanylate cyclase (GGDEF)-like protein/PAS domain S-box-containing protein